MKKEQQIKGREFLYVLEKIKLANVAVSDKNPVKLIINSDFNEKIDFISPKKFIDILEFLQEQKAIEIFGRVGEENGNVKRTVFILDVLEPAFDGISDYYNPNTIAYWIKYNKKREIVINDKYVLKELQFERPSDIFFDYLYKNPGRMIKKSEFPVSVFSGTRKDHTLHKLVNRIGFSGELKKCFFDVSKSSVEFFKEVKRGDLEDKGVNEEELKKQLKKLEIFN